MMIISGIRKYPVGALFLLSLILSGWSAAAMAQDDVDLTDNEVCLGCHEGTEWTAPENSDRPRVHEDSGAFIQPDHEMWSCTDCHADITEIPHREGVERTVECTNCHESTPTL